MSDRLCVVMPVYNEQDAIGPVLEKWDAALKDLGIDYEIRPYNDGSKDGSLKVMHEVSQKLGERINVRDKKNGGHGNTILTGYREAAKDGFDWVFQIDSDDEMGPEKFNELWSHRNDYDFLVGIRDGRIQALPRKVISFVSRLCVRIFYGKSVWDVNTPYRLMRISAFKDFYAQIPLTTFAPNVILSGLAARHKLRCFEIRVPQHDRTTGEVSIKKWKLMRAAAKSFWQTIGFSFWRGKDSKALTMLERVFVGLMVGLFLFTFADNPFADFAATDSSVFYYIGSAMHRGIVPYRDVFDHKGPLIYVLNWLGSFTMPSLIGVWLIEAFISLAALALVYGFLRRFFVKGAAITTTFLYAALFAFANMGGNFTETYAHLPIIFVLLATFASIIGGTPISKGESFIFGCCFAAIILLRPNMGVVGFVAALYFLDCFVRDRDIKKLLVNSGFVLIGLVLFSLPFVGYLVANGAVSDCWACYITYNLSYATGTQTTGKFFPMAIVICLLGVLPCFDKSWRRVGVYNLVFFLTTSFLLYLNSAYLHYFVMLIPGIIVPVAWMSERMCKVKFVSAINKIIVLCAILMLALVVVQYNMDIKGYVRHVAETKRIFDVAPYKEGANLNSLIEFIKLIKDRESVQVLGNNCEIYRRLGCRPCGYYAYIPDDFNGKIEPAVLENLKNHVNRYIITNDTLLRPCYKDALEAAYKPISHAGDYGLWEAK